MDVRTSLQAAGNMTTPRPHSDQQNDTTSLLCGDEYIVIQGRQVKASMGGGAMDGGGGRGPCWGRKTPIIGLRYCARHTLQTTICPTHPQYFSCGTHYKGK